MAELWELRWSSGLYEDAIGFHWFVWPYNPRGFHHTDIVARGRADDEKTARSAAAAACRLFGTRLAGDNS